MKKALAVQKRSATATPQLRPSQSFSGSEKNLAKIIMMVSQLADLYDKAVTPSRLKGYALALQSENIEVLQAAFARAARTLKYFPSLAEILKLCSLDTWEMADQLRADDVWTWVVKYVQQKYDFQGRPTYELGGESSCDLGTFDRKVSARRLDMRKQYFAEPRSVATILEYKCPGVWVRKITPPRIPDDITYALTQLGGDKVLGLRRIQEDLEEPRKIGFLRRDFDNAYQRAIARERRQSTSKTPLALLAGDIAKPGLPPATVSWVLMGSQRRPDPFYCWEAKMLCDRGYISVTDLPFLEQRAEQLRACEERSSYRDHTAENVDTLLTLLRTPQSS